MSDNESEENTTMNEGQGRGGVQPPTISTPNTTHLIPTHNQTTLFANTSSMTSDTLQLSPSTPQLNKIKGDMFSSMVSLYKGNPLENFNQWLAQLEGCFKFNGITDSKFKALAMQLRLTGSALATFLRYTESQRSDYAFMVNEMRKIFMRKDQVDMNAMALDNRYFNKETETIHEYYLAITELAETAFPDEPGKDMRETRNYAIMKQFKLGLPRWLQQIAARFGTGMTIEELKVMMDREISVKQRYGDEADTAFNEVSDTGRPGYNTPRRSHSFNNSNNQTEQHNETSEMLQNNRHLTQQLAELTRNLEKLHTSQTVQSQTIAELVQSSFLPPPQAPTQLAQPYQPVAQQQQYPPYNQYPPRQYNNNRPDNNRGYSYRGNYQGRGYNNNGSYGNGYQNRGGYQRRDQSNDRYRQYREPYRNRYQQSDNGRQNGYDQYRSRSMERNRYQSPGRGTYQSPGRRDNYQYRRDEYRSPGRGEYRNPSSERGRINPDRDNNYYSPQRDREVERERNNRDRANSIERDRQQRIHQHEGVRNQNDTDDHYKEYQRAGKQYCRHCDSFGHSPSQCNNRPDAVRGSSIPFPMEGKN